MNTHSILNKSVVCPLVVGRASYLEAINQQIERAQHGHGSTLLLSGEAGIGKSRLVAESKTLVTNLGFAVLQGNCFEPDRVLPYAPLIDLLRNFCISQSSSDLSEHLHPYAADLVKLLPELATLWPDLPASPPADPKQEKRRLFQTLTRFFVERNSQSFDVTQDKLAIHNSQLIILEDLHWCDDTSLDFLLYLARRLANLPILLLLTYRNDEAQTSLKQFLVDLDRERCASELRLIRLPSVDTELMIRMIFEQTQPVRQEFVDKIYTLTEGNPFFVEETLKSLVEAGDIFYVDGHWDRKALADLHVPRTVQLAVTQRSAQLSPPVHDLLVLASVAGRRFDFTLLQAITGHDDRELARLLKELLRAQLVVEESAEVFAFRHALTQQSIYSDLLRRERIPLHRTIAETIERLHANPRETKLADLSFHYHNAQVWDKAIEYGRRAGERAQVLHAPGAAVEHFTRAIHAADLVPTPSPTMRGALLRARGQAHEVLGRFEDARLDYEAALAAAQSAQSAQTIWQSFVDLGYLWAQRDYGRAGEYFQQALATARSMGDALLLGHTLKRLGNWHMNMEHPDEAVHHLNEALHIFEGLNDQRGIAETLDLLGISNIARSDAIEGARCYDRAIAIFRSLGDPAGEMSSLLVYAPRHSVYINNVAIWSPVPLSERIRDGERALQMARKLGAKPAEALGLIWSSNTFGMAGEYEQGLSALRAGLALAEEIEHLHLITTAHMVLGSLFWDMQLLNEAQTHLEKALSTAHKSNSLVWLGGIVGYLASTQLQRGDLAAAENTLQQFWQPSLPLRSNGQRQVWCVRAELLLARREASEALHIVETLIHSDPHTLEVGEQAIPRLARLRGEALTQLGRYAEAEAILRASQPYAQETPGLLWRLHLTLGNLYRRQNRRAEVDRSYAVARAVLAQLATKIHDADLHQRFVEQTQTLFPTATEKQVAKQSFAGLTAKERAVAALIGRGKSNKEIAEAMVVSFRTVETHVSNILSKLHLASRAQVAIWANEQGVTD